MIYDKSGKKHKNINDPYLRYNHLEDEMIYIRNLKNYQDEEKENARYDSYADYDLDRIRDKRHIDITPLQERELRSKSYLTPLFVITAVFGALLIIGPLLVRKGPNRGITQACIMLTAGCMWIFWFTIYFGQMNPLMGPRLENTTVAWIAYKLGNPALVPPNEAAPGIIPPGPSEPDAPEPDPSPEEPPEEPPEELPLPPEERLAQPLPNDMDRRH